MEQNRTLIEKADLALSDLVGSGGYLKTGQVKKFIRLIIDKAVLMKDVMVTPMSSHTEERDTVTFSGRVLKPGSEGVALAEAERSKPDLGRVTISSVLYRAEVRLTDEVLEDNIERGDFERTILDLFSEALSRDIEEVLIQGDTASTDPLLATQDGVLKRITSNVVDAAGASLSKTILHSMLKALPDRYHSQPRLTFYSSVKAVSDYVDSLSGRATALGDAAIVRGDVLKFRGVPIKAVPKFPEVASKTNVLLADPKNLVLGFWRKVKIKRDEDVRAGLVYFVASVRFGVAVFDEEACVKAINVSVA